MAACVKRNRHNLRCVKRTRQPLYTNLVAAAGISKALGGHVRKEVDQLRNLKVVIGWAAVVVPAVLGILAGIAGTVVWQSDHEPAQQNAAAQAYMSSSEYQTIQALRNMGGNLRVIQSGRIVRIEINVGGGWRIDPKNTQAGAQSAAVTVEYGR